MLLFFVKQKAAYEIRISDWSSDVCSSDLSNSRFHSDWLTMMASRLRLARTLLKDDGCIFISIDDGEIHNLRALCDATFGPTNFNATIIWHKMDSPKNSAKYLSEDQDRKSTRLNSSH